MYKRQVINFVRDFLDERIPLAQISWKNVSKFKIEENKLIIFSDSKKYFLKNNEQFIGYKGDKENPNSILIKNNNLHIDILINSKTMVGKIDNAAISDIVIESALSTIVDNEDSVAAATESSLSTIVDRADSITISEMAALSIFPTMVLEFIKISI